MNEALVQRADAHEPRVASTVFWLTNIGGVVLFGIAWLIAPLIGSWGPDDTVGDVFKVLAITFVVATLGSAHGSLLEHSLDFKRASVPRILGGLGKGLTSIGAALGGAGLWSLVAGQIASGVVQTTSTWCVSRFRPQLVIDWTAARPVVRLGLGLMGVSILTTAAASIDYVIVGAMLGAEALGLYYLAFRLPELLVGSITGVAWKVLFPVYARIQDGEEHADGESGAALTRGFLRSVRLASFVVLPLGFGLAALSEPLMALFGPSWKEAATPMALIAIWVALSGIGGMPGVAFKAMGRPLLIVRTTMIDLAIVVPALIVGTRWGITGVAVAHVLARLAWITYVYYFASRVLGTRWRDPFVTMLPGLVISLATAALVYPIGRFLPTAPALLLGIPAAVVAFGLITRLRARDDFDRLIDAVRTMRREPRAATT